MTSTYNQTISTIARAKQFLKISKMPKTTFGKEVQLSQSMLSYVFNGERELSHSAEQRINSFIDDCITKLNEI